MSTDRKGQVLWIVGAVLIMVYALVPVAWIVSLSFKAGDDITNKKFRPTDWSFENYRIVFSSDLFTSALRNSGVAPDEIDRLSSRARWREPRPSDDHTGDRVNFTLSEEDELFAGTLVVTFFVLTDMLDGAMARRLSRRSVFGAWLDSTCDRLADAAVFSGLVLWFMGDGDDRLLAGLALFCLVAGSLVSYAKARAEGLGLTCNVGFAERAERLIIVLVAAGLSGLGLTWALPVGLWALAVASAVTVVQRLLEVRRQAAAAAR